MSTYRPLVPKFPTDIRDAVAAVASAAAIVDEMRAAFLASSEMRMLRSTFAQNVRVQLRISSSNKYTRFEFPHCPRLLIRIQNILIENRCEIIGTTHAHGTTVEIGIPRLGCADETIDWAPT